MTVKTQGMKRIVWFITVACLLSFSCRGPSEGEDNSDTTPADSGTALSAAQIRNAGITFGLIEKKQLSFDIRAKGKLILAPGNLATIGTAVGGTIRDIRVRQGMPVRKGEVLASISSPEIIRMQQEYATAAGRCRLAESDFLRQKSLVKEGIASDRKFQEAEAAFREAQIIREALRVQLEQLNLPVSGIENGEVSPSAPIVSPINGVVDHVEVNLGRFAAPGDLLFTVVDKSRLSMELMVFEKDVAFIKTGQRVTFELANLSTREYEARVISIGRTVEENARTVRVLADFNNDSPDILPGMFVAAEIHTDEQDLNALPEEAILTGQDGSWCYYALQDGADSITRFYRLPLKTGFREDGYVEAEPLSPLPAGARIVMTGAYFIRAEGLKNAD